MDFEWDARKSRENLAERGIDFQKGVQVFLDPFRKEGEDTRRDYGETRMKTIGIVDGVELTVVYTFRGENIRIISVRRASRHERRIYHTRETAS